MITKREKNRIQGLTGGVLMGEEIKTALVYILVFVLVWTGVDFVLSLIRAITFVLARTIQTALSAGIISYVLFRILLRR